MTTRFATHAIVVWTLAKHRVANARRNERGEVTAQVILIAVFAALAIAVGAIIVTKVTDRANSIPTS